jgi:hypothetical protein
MLVQEEDAGAALFQMPSGPCAEYARAYDHNVMFYRHVGMIAEE